MITALVDAGFVGPVARVASADSFIPLGAAGAARAAQRGRTSRKQPIDARLGPRTLHDRHRATGAARHRPPAQRRRAGHPGQRPRVRRPAGPAAHRGVVRAGRARPGADPGGRRARAARHAPGGVRLRRDQRGLLRPGLPGAGGRRLRRAQPGLGAGIAGDVRDLEVRQRGAEAGLAAPDGRRRGDRLLRADRARLRLQPGGHADPGQAATATTGC